MCQLFQAQKQDALLKIPNRTGILYRSLGASHNTVLFLCTTPFVICRWTWMNFKSGYKFKSTVNGKSIFLPAARRLSSSLDNAAYDGPFWCAVFSQIHVWPASAFSPVADVGDGAFILPRPRLAAIQHAQGKRKIGKRKHNDLTPVTPREEFSLP